MAIPTCIQTPKPLTQGLVQLFKGSPAFHRRHHPIFSGLLINLLICAPRTSLHLRLLLRNFSFNQFIITSHSSKRVPAPQNSVIKLHFAVSQMPKNTGIPTATLKDITTCESLRRVAILISRPFLNLMTSHDVTAVNDGGQNRGQLSEWG